MALVECKECGKEVSKKAAACPHCGYKAKRTSLFTWVVTIFVAVPILLAVFTGAVVDSGSSSTKSSEQTTAERQRTLERRRESYAIIIAEKVINDQLKAPSTADFSSILDTEIARLRDGGPNEWIVKGYVDAQNGFGAMIRSNYQVVIEFEEGKHDSYRITTADLY